MTDLAAHVTYSFNATTTFKRVGTFPPQPTLLFASPAHPACHTCLQVVSVTDLTTHVTYWFDANMWFDRNQGDGLIDRVLMALPAEPRIRRYGLGVLKSPVAG